MLKDNIDIMYTKDNEKLSDEAMLAVKDDPALVGILETMIKRSY